MHLKIMVPPKIEPAISKLVERIFQRMCIQSRIFFAFFCLDKNNLAIAVSQQTLGVWKIFRLTS